jgi:hypothetical protein
VPHVEVKQKYPTLCQDVTNYVEQGVRGLGSNATSVLYTEDG